MTAPEEQAPASPPPRVLLLLASKLDPAGGRLITSLSGVGWTVRILSPRADGTPPLSLQDAAAILFDPHLIGLDGVAALRHEHPDRPLIGWLSRPSSTLAAALIEAGADEVLSGAMGERELAMRTARALRRRGASPHGPLAVGELTVDLGAAEVRWEGRELELTRRERELLSVLASAVGRTLRREAIHRAVWGHAMARGDRTVDVTVSRLRRRLAAAGAAVEIATQPGVGYRLLAPDEAPDETP